MGESENGGLPSTPDAFTRGAEEPNIDRNIVDDDIGPVADMPELWLINYGDMIQERSLPEFGVRLLIGVDIETGHTTLQYELDGDQANMDGLKLLGALAWVNGQARSLIESSAA